MQAHAIASEGLHSYSLQPCYFWHLLLRAHTVDVAEQAVTVVNAYLAV